ncbi:hypothetical protein BJ165DRAFT_998094 [Panaeolus papilionaceus]|nr:hypothetical protein BJ165DRAFT_998094 [Panaeolus papilionaceus]
MALPQELIDAIIDTLEDDVESLRKCTLVSSAFLTRAQKHLFRQITLSSGQTTLPARLTNLLSESPHISRTITSLRVVQKKQKRTKGSQAWLHIDNSLTDALPSIREFSLECATWASWSSFPSVTKSAFHSLFASGTLVRLTLDSISDVPYQLLECVPTLQELHLKNAAFKIPDTFDEIQLPLPFKKARLTHLHISGHVFEPIQPFVEWMLTSCSCLDLSGLQHFTLLIPYDCGAMLADQVDVINRVVVMCSHSLKELNIIPSLGGA